MQVLDYTELSINQIGNTGSPIDRLLHIPIFQRSA